MATQLQFRRYTSDQIADIIGKAGEIFINLDDNSLVIHDGETAGGNPLKVNYQDIVGSILNLDPVSDSGPSRLSIGSTTWPAGTNSGIISELRLYKKNNNYYSLKVDASDNRFSLYHNQDNKILSTDDENNLIVENHLHVKGNITFGEDGEPLETITINANFSGDIVPDTNNAYDLGLSNNKWKSIYAHDLTLNNYTLPDEDGTVGQAIITHGDGTTSFQDISSTLTIQANDDSPGTVSLVSDTFKITGADGVEASFNDTSKELSLSTKYNTSIGDNVQSVAVGGAAAAPASDWKEKTIIQALDTILFPTLLPTYTIPTITLTGNQNGQKEVGEVINQVLTLNGNKNDAGAFTSLTIKRTSTGNDLGTTTSPTITALANVADQFGYSNPNNPNQRFTYIFTDTYTLPYGNTTWKGSGTYNDGLPKKDNKGIDDSRNFALRTTSAPQSAGTIETSALTITAIYPYYWGVSSSQPTESSIATLIENGDSSVNRVLANSSGTITIAPNASSQYIWFAHASVYTPKTKWFNTTLNQGNIDSGEFILSPVTQSITAANNIWTNIPFEVYISGYATSTSGNYEFRN